jgi:lincosamide nucleotidyltransferase
LPEEQLRLIAGVRALSRADPDLDAALMYGSFVATAAEPAAEPAGTASGSGTSGADEYSDIEFWLFHTVSPADPRGWIEQVSPVTHVVLNEFGAHVAFFPGLIRGEFHFAGVADISTVRSWPAGDIEIIVDRRGELAQSRPQAEIDRTADVCGRFANWLLLAHHVGQRGEVLRQRDALAHAQRHLLWMARLVEGRTEHWLTPSRRAESELSAATIAGFGRTHEDVGAAWQAGRALWIKLDPDPPGALFAELDRALGPGPRSRPAGPAAPR